MAIERCPTDCFPKKGKKEGISHCDISQVGCYSDDDKC